MTLERHIWAIPFSQKGNNNKSVKKYLDWKLQNYKKKKNKNKQTNKQTMCIPILLLKWLLEFQVKKEVAP